MAIVEIPFSPQPQRFSIALADILYRMRVLYNEADEGGWTLDIGDAEGVLLLAGLPLVTGVDLFAPHRHLGFGGSLVVTTDRDTGETPTREGLGLTSHVYFVTAP